MVVYSRTLVFALVAGVSAFSNQGVRADVPLRMKFTKGETYKYDLTNKMSATQAEGSSNLEQVVTTAVHVKDVKADGSARVRQTTERVRMTLLNVGNGQEMKLSFDSAKDEVPTDPVKKSIVEPVNAMVGAAFELTIDPHGNMTEIEVPKAVLAALSKSPNSAALGDLNTEEGMKRLLSQGTINFPKNPVAKGATWDRELLMNLPFGKMKTLMRYTYDGPNTPPIEQISARMGIALEPNPASPIKVSMSLEEAGGKFLFDNKQGKLKESSLTQKMKLTTTMPNQKPIVQSTTTSVVFQLLPSE